MEGFGGLRDLHAKIVTVVGARSRLVYLGSANFTARGWGFLPEHSMANVEAGLILLGPAGSSFAAGLEPPVCGKPIPVGGSEPGEIAVPEAKPLPAPWPFFLREVLLQPVAGDRDRLRLAFTLLPGIVPAGWSARLQRKEGLPDVILVPESQTTAAQGSLAVALEPEWLNRLLVEQQVWIAWPEHPAGVAVPVNVDAEARLGLPVAPGQGPLQENQLLAYYQGRIAWEALFPSAEEDGDSPSGTVQAAGEESGVDKSRIQSYQVREFVEAIEGIRGDLKQCLQSEGAIRLALLGPVSPVALARTVIEATKNGEPPRSPTAAGFQLTELLVCLVKARKNDVPGRLRLAWDGLLGEAEDQIGTMLEELEAQFAPELGSNTTFQRYRRAVYPKSKATP